MGNFVDFAPGMRQRRPTGHRDYAVEESLHCFPSKAGGDQIALVSHIKGVSQKDAAGLMLGQSGPGTGRSGTKYQYSPSP
jgi:hypothetical protein